jgi:hypothetical protein
MALVIRGDIVLLGISKSVVSVGILLAASAAQQAGQIVAKIRPDQRKVPVEEGYPSAL